MYLCGGVPTNLPVGVGVVVEDGIPPLVVLLVVNIHTLVSPLLSHSGELVIPDLVKDWSEPLSLVTT